MQVWANGRRIMKSYCRDPELTSSQQHISCSKQALNWIRLWILWIFVLDIVFLVFKRCCLVFQTSFFFFQFFFVFVFRFLLRQMRRSSRTCRPWRARSSGLAACGRGCRRRRLGNRDRDLVDSRPNSSLTDSLLGNSWRFPVFPYVLLSSSRLVGFPHLLWLLVSSRRSPCPRFWRTTNSWRRPAQSLPIIFTKKKKIKKPRVSRTCYWKRHVITVISCNHPLLIPSESSASSVHKHNTCTTEWLQLTMSGFPKIFYIVIQCLTCFEDDCAMIFCWYLVGMGLYIYTYMYCIYVLGGLCWSVVCGCMATSRGSWKLRGAALSVDFFATADTSPTRETAEIEAVKQWCYEILVLLSKSTQGE